MLSNKTDGEEASSVCGSYTQKVEDWKVPLLSTA